jgi:hypothetical protein
MAALVLAAGALVLILDRPMAAQNAVQAAAGWGDIKGKIVWAGDVPAPKELNVDKDQQHCLEKGKLFNEEWVIDKDSKGVRHVFVWLTLDPKGAVKELPIKPDLKEIKVKEVEIDQPCCGFVPHALAMREGQILVAKNSSPIAHNFNYSGFPTKNPGKNFLMAPGSKQPIDNLKADEKFPVSVNCNVHGWMKAYIRVFDHPYYAVTDKDGNFEIKNAPAGNWKLKIWHDSGWLGGAAGRDGRDIEVKSGGATDLGKVEWKQ